MYIILALPMHHYLHPNCIGYYNYSFQSSDGYIIHASATADNKGLIERIHAKTPDIFKY